MSSIEGPGRSHTPGEIPQPTLSGSDAKTREAANQSFGRRTSYDFSGYKYFGANDALPSLDPVMSALDGVVEKRKDSAQGPLLIHMQQAAQEVAGVLSPLREEGAWDLSRSRRSTSGSDLTRTAIAEKALSTGEVRGTESVQNAPPLRGSLLVGFRAIFTAVMESFVNYFKEVTAQRDTIQQDLIALATSTFKNVLTYIQKPVPQVGTALSEMGHLYDVIEKASTKP